MAIPGHIWRGRGAVSTASCRSDQPLPTRTPRAATPRNVVGHHPTDLHAWSPEEESSRNHDQNARIHTNGQPHCHLEESKSGNVLMHPASRQRRTWTVVGDRSRRVEVARKKVLENLQRMTGPPPLTLATMFFFTSKGRTKVVVARTVPCKVGEKTVAQRCASIRYLQIRPFAPSSPNEQWISDPGCSCRSSQ